LLGLRNPLEPVGLTVKLTAVGLVGLIGAGPAAEILEPPGEVLVGEVPVVDVEEMPLVWAPAPGKVRVGVPTEIAEVKVVGGPRKLVLTLLMLGKLPGGARRPIPDTPDNPAGGDNLPIPPVPILVPGREERIAPGATIRPVVPTEVTLVTEVVVVGVVIPLVGVVLTTVVVVP
jgi:hypothetical protein